MTARSNPWMACIIVTYNPDLDMFRRLLTQLRKSDVAVYIIDNRFSEECTDHIRCLCRTVGDIDFIALDENRGIAAAINVGIEKAQADSHRLVMLFDQDSVPQDGLLEELREVAERLSGPGSRVAAIAPRLYDPRSQTFFRFARLKWGLWRKLGCRCGDGSLLRCEFLNSSGSLLFLQHWAQIGPFRENFFIDHVETEWDMRVRHAGLECYGFCSRAYLEHHMGNNISRYWFFGWRHMPRRPPQRHYTIVRNALWMWRMKHVPFSWIINSSMKIAFTLFYFSLFDKEAESQRLYILRGIRDGLFLKPHEVTSSASSIPGRMHKEKSYL